MIPFHSHEEALSKGCKYRGHVPCPVCGMLVGIYQIPGQWPCFVDTETFWPHIVAIHNEQRPPVLAVDGKSATAGDR